ncbi:ATP-dependent RecD-like DNA helicase [Lacrimispora amygdalina]|uniref:ATP-dependent RecD2 DNA helicase n=1 Tax=Lacrimispora amygdalina TaxID=253257 RepID=A0A3E2N987_9FIRM|nr:ATP-dependent RecD-like DNA helicase [Clostridium indicum]RFZ77490.1 ATP-dependent RecD-like DNA helicase [Clostridium indicum]
MNYIGTYDGTIFYNPTNKYCIISVKTKDQSVPPQARATRQYRDHLIRFVAVGYELPRTDAVQLELDGEWVNGKYGQQLQVEQWHEIVPRTADGVEGYLASGLIKGIGPKMAAEIVARFGVETLDILEKHPERLLEVKGITENKLEDIKVSYAESRMLQDLMTLLSPYKITPKTALRIYQHFGPDSVEVLQRNPFELCKISGFGFRRVDAIVQKNGNDLHDPMRVKGALICTLDEIRGKQGHLYLDSESLVNLGLKLLNEKIPLPGMRLHKQEVEDALQDMILNGDVVMSRNNIYLPRVFMLEDDAARQIATRLVAASTVEHIPLLLEQIKTEIGISLSGKQDKAVRVAFQNNISIITGSPGTGKTTVLKTILEVYRRLHPDGKIMLMAPTGRASRRMAESTGFEDAKTMHSGLGLGSEEDESGRKKEVAPLAADLVIVDEFSMVDMWLAKQFFTRLKDGCRVVLVGDADQLPSVGAGNVFRELINCGLVPVTVLNEIFRQAEDSLIAHNAKFINEGSTKLYYGPDFVFHSCDNQEETAEKIMEFYRNEITENGIEQVQILSPFRSAGAASAEQLNEAIRELVNPFSSTEEEIKLGPKNFRVGDRIMQTKNTEKVSNGDLGFIRYIKETEDGKRIGVDFGATRQLEYGVEDLVNLDLAYATTIHKAMGAECETVIMPLLKAHTVMLYRNLLYTAITRAKKRVVLVGQKAVLFMAIHRNEISKRNTSLGERICLYYRAFAKNAGVIIPAALEEKLKNAG